MLPGVLQESSEEESSSEEDSSEDDSDDEREERLARQREKQEARRQVSSPQPSAQLFRLVDLAVLVCSPNAGCRIAAAEGSCHACRPPWRRRLATTCARPSAASWVTSTPVRLPA